MKRLALTGLIPGKSYSVQVRSRTDEGTSPWSQSLDFTAIVDSTPPEVPSNPVWVVSGTSFVGTWDALDLTHTNNQDFSYYRVEVSDGIKTVAYGVSTNRFDFSFEMNVAAFGTPKATVSFTVKSVDLSGNMSDPTALLSATNPPPLPVTVTVTPGVESIQVSWAPTADTDIKGYNIYMSQSAGFTPGPTNKLYVETLSWTPITTSVSPWYFQVRAVDVFNQESTSVQVSGTATTAATSIDLTPPNPPSAPSVSAGFDAATQQPYYDVTWTNSTSTDVRDYIIRSTIDGTHYNYETALASGYRIYVTGGATYTIGVAAEDFTGNVSSYVDAAATAAAADTTAPSTPAAPTASGNTMQMQVTHNNLKAAGGAMESDVVYYNVYASKTTGFTANAGNYFGKITKSTTTSQVFPLPVTTASGTAAEQWFVVVEAVDRAGNESDQSAEGTVTPNLITNSNIVDATITSAKIVSLAADKLTAGLGIITDLVIGNGTANSGSISSGDYVAGTTGFKIGYDKTLPSGSRTVLEINQGLVRAAALELKNSFNVMPWAYSTFEYKASFFSTLSKTNATAVIDTDVPASVGQTQSIKVTTTNTSNRVYLGVLATDYNIRTEAGKPYIVSYWAKTDTGTKTLTARLTSSTGTTYDAAPQTVTTSWTRYSAVLSPAASGSVLSFAAAEIGNYWIDAIQVEEKIGALSTPTSYNPPSMTSIDAGVITTGSIQSTSTVTVGSVTVPAWFIDMAGGAQFSDARVLGTITVGGTNIAGGGGSDTANSSIKSNNFTNAVGVEAGWMIDGSGNAYLNSAIIRGTLAAALISGNLTMSGGIIRTSGSPIPRLELDSTSFRSYGREGALTAKFSIFTGAGPFIVEQHSNMGNKMILYAGEYATVYNLDGTVFSQSDLLWNDTIAVGEDSSGFKYVYGETNGVRNKVKKFAVPDTSIYPGDPYASVVNTFTVTSGGIDMTVDTAGNFYILYPVSGNNSSVKKYNSSGILQATYTITNSDASIITTDQVTNDFLVLGTVMPAATSQKIERYSNIGSLLSSFTPTNVSYRAMRVDKTNQNIFLASSGTGGEDPGNIRRYTSAGVAINPVWGDSAFASLTNFGYTSILNFAFDYNTLDVAGLPNIVALSNNVERDGTRITQSVDTSTVISTSTGFVDAKQGRFSVRLSADSIYTTKITSSDFSSPIEIKGRGSWNQKFQTGSDGDTIAVGDNYVDIPITFYESFYTAPSVFCQYTGGSQYPYEASPLSVTTTGFTLRLKRPYQAATTSTATVAASWLAVWG